jgi:hypothetical protein
MPTREQTVRDAVDLARASGLSEQAIAEQWQKTTGIPLSEVRADTPLSRVRAAMLARNKPQTIEDRETASPDELDAAQEAEILPRKGWAQSAAEDVTVGALGIPAMAAGAAAGALSLIPSGDVQKTQQPNMADEAFADTMQIVRDRKEMSGAETVRADAGDIAAGGHMLLDLALGTAQHGGEREPTFLGAVSKGLQGRALAGAQLVSGAVGGTAGEVGAFATDPGGTVHAMPLSTALAAVPFVGPAAQGIRRLGRVARARNFNKFAHGAERAALIAERAAAPIDATMQKTQDVPLHTDASVRDATALYKRVQDGEITIQEAAAAMDRLHPGRASIAYKALNAAASGLDKGASAIKWGGIGALAGDIIPGGGLAGAAVGAALPSVAGLAKKAISPEFRRKVAHNVQDSYAQTTPEETARAREVLDTSRHIAGGIVAATEVAGGRAQRGVSIDPNAQKVPVPAPGMKVRTIAEDGVGMPRNEAMAREALSEVVGNEGRNIAREREVAKIAREQSDRMLDKENPEYAQALRDKQFLEDRLRAADDKYAEMQKRNDEAWERHQNRRNYTMQALQEKGAELRLAEGQAADAYRTFAARWKEWKEGLGIPTGTPQDNAMRAMKASNPAHPAHAEWRAMVDARTKAKGLRNYVSKVKDTRAEFGAVAERLWHDKEILRRRRVARKRLLEGYNDDIAERFARERTALEQRIEGARLEGKKGLMHRLEQKLAWLNEDEAVRQSRPRVGLLDLRKKVREVDRLRPAARRAANLERDARRAAYGEKAHGTKPMQQGAAQRAAQMVRGKLEHEKPVDLPIRDRELDQAAGLAKKSGQGERSVTTLDPASGMPDRVFEGATDDVHELANQGGKKEIFTRDEVARWMTEGLHDQSLTLMRDPGFRGLVEARLTKGLPKGQAAKVRAALDDHLVDNVRHALAAEPDSMILRMPDGGEVSILDVTKNVLDDMRKTPDGASKARQIMRSATRRVGVHLAAQAEETALARGLESEFLRTHVNPSTVEDSLPPTKAALMAAARGEPLPMLLGVDPKKAAQVMRANVDVLAKELGVPVERAKHLLDRMESEFVPIDANARELLRRAERADHIVRLPEQLYVTKGFNDSLKARIAGIDSFREVADLAMRFSRAAKLSLTAYNLPAHIHNITSNLVYQSARRGTNPLTLMREWVQTANEWKQYLNGNRADDSRMRALAKTGFAATNALDDELDALTMAPPKSILSPVGKAQHMVGRVGMRMGHLYKLGDNIPKLHEATKQFDAILKGAKEIATGSTFELDFGGGLGRLYRKLDNERMVGPDGKPVRIDSQQFYDDIAKAAVKPALDIFHDYGDAPAYLRAMKRHGVTGIFSPFYTWLFKSIDAPGKKGLVSHMFDYMGDGAYRTNDPTVFSRRAKQGALLSVRRSAMMNAGRSMLHEDRENLQAAAGYTPRMMALSHFETIPGTGYVDITSHDAANPFAGFDYVWRGGTGLLASALGSSTWIQNEMFDQEDIEAAPKQMWAKRLRSLWSKEKSGEWFEPEDALAAIGMAGTPLLEALKLLDDSQRGGADLEKAAWLFTKLMLGGTVAGVIDVARETVEPGSAGRREIGILHPDFDNSEGANLLQRERLGDFVVRKLFSLGTRTVNVGEQQAWRRKKAKAFLDALNDAKQKRLGELMLEGRDAELDPVFMELDRLGWIVYGIQNDRSGKDFDVWLKGM